VILLTVGTQLPFDRLVRLVDEIAPTLDQPVYAQIGRAIYLPRNMAYERAIDPVSFEALMAKTTLVVAHAGIGTVMTAQRHGKPLIVFPRLANLGEHRNDHQRATANALAGRKGIYVAHSPTELEVLLKLPPVQSPPAGEFSSHTRLCTAITDFIDSGGRRS